MIATIFAVVAALALLAAAERDSRRNAREAAAKVTTR